MFVFIMFLVVGCFFPSAFRLVCFSFSCLGWLISAFSIHAKGYWFWPLSFILDQRVSDLHSGLCSLTSNWILAFLYLIFLILWFAQFIPPCISFHHSFFSETLEVFVASHLQVSLFTFYEKCWCLNFCLCLDFYTITDVLPKSSPQSTNLVKNYTKVCLLFLLYLSIKLFLLCSRCCLIC